MFTELVGGILIDLIEWAYIDSLATLKLQVLSGKYFIKLIYSLTADRPAGYLKSGGVKTQDWVKPSQPAMNQVWRSMFKCKNGKRKETTIGKLVFSFFCKNVIFFFGVVASNTTIAS